MNKIFPSPFAGFVRTALPALGIAAALFATSAASAAIVITTAGTAPTDGLYKANLPSASPGNVTLYWRGQPRGEPYTPDVVRTVGQGLSTVGAATPLNLSAITFLVASANENVLGMTLQLTIYETAAAGTAPNPANILETHTGTLPDALAKGDYLTLKLDAPLLLQPDKHYTFICSFTGPTSTDASALSLSLATTGTGVSNLDSSRRWISSDGVYDASTSNGFVFYVQAAPVPEPGSFAFLGVALLGLGIRQRIWNH